MSSTVFESSVGIQGEMQIPVNAQCAILLVGTGVEPECDAVSRALHGVGLGDARVHLLTREEQLVDSITGRPRRQTDQLAARLLGATEWLRRQPEMDELPLGVCSFGAGAAAMLVAAAARPGAFGAVVSIGGLVELASCAVERVREPMLFIVAGHDYHLLRATRAVIDRAGGGAELAVVAGVADFTEAASLGEAARVAADWLRERMRPRPTAQLQ